MEYEKDIYRYDDTGKILIREYSGVITAKKLLKSWDYIFTNNLLNKSHIGTITNYSHAHSFNISHQDILDSRIFFAQHYDLFSKIRQAQVAITPEIAFAVLLNKQFPQFEMKEFSKFDHALNWVLSSKS